MNHRLPLLNFISYISLVISNFLAVQLPFFGRTPGDISDLFPRLLTPANFAFSIWSFIYVLLGVFIWVQSKPLFHQKLPPSPAVSAIGTLFFASCFFNITWLIAWQALYMAWSFVLIFALWIVLIVIYYRLAMLEKVSWTYTIPFSIYLAWVCISTLANLNVMLAALDFNFFGISEVPWTASLIGLGICGTLLMLYLNQDLWFTLVLNWAFFGIYVKNKQVSEEPNVVMAMALFAIVFLTLVGAGVGWWKWKRSGA